MQQRLAEETEGFQKTLEAERRRQLDITAEAERLKLQVAEMSMAQAKAEEEAKRFKKQAEEISERLHETELATQEKMTMVHTLEIQRHQSDEDAEKLRKAIADLENEKEKLKQEAALLQQKAEEVLGCGSPLVVVVCREAVPLPSQPTPSLARSPRTITGDGGAGPLVQGCA